MMTKTRASAMTAAELKALRDNLGLTQREMADKLVVSRAVLQRWEAGTTPISARTAMAIRAVVEQIFLQHAPEEYLELIRELQSKIVHRQLTSKQGKILFEALGGHYHHCDSCGVEFRCYCPQKLGGGNWCDECAPAEQGEVA